MSPHSTKPAPETKPARPAPPPDLIDSLAVQFAAAQGESNRERGDEIAAQVLEILPAARERLEEVASTVNGAPRAGEITYEQQRGLDRRISDLSAVVEAAERFEARAREATGEKRPKTGGEGGGGGQRRRNPKRLSLWNRFEMMQSVIFDAPVQTAAQRLVLVTIAGRVHHTRGYAWPSIRKLAKWTGLAPSTVQRALAGLVEHRIIRKIPRGNRQTTRYIINAADWPRQEELGFDDE